MEEAEKIRQFTLNFFKNLGCEMFWQNKTLIVEKIPKNFQDFFGKKEPFKLVFRQEDLKEDYELVSKGSSLIKKMNEYLDGKGQTTLAKISIDITEKDILKNFDLINCEISEIIKRRNYKSIIRFVFITNFQYLNENDQVMTAIYTKDGKIVDFNPSDYEIKEGNKSELGEIEIESEYEIAKDKIRDLIEPKKNQVVEKINKLLNKEIERVKSHRNSIKEEIINNIRKLENQLNSLKDDLEKIERIKKQLIQENIRLKESESEDEEKFLLSQEIQKHSLSIKNRLLNTTIFYYPEISLGIFLKNKKTKRFVEVKSDGIEKTFSEIKCDSCGQVVKEILLCSSGHISCKNCAEECKSCGEIICNKCFKKDCSECGRKFCANCITTCSQCRKSFCKSHLNKSNITNELICDKCSKICKECNQRVELSFIKQNISGKELCIKCWSKEFEKGL